MLDRASPEESASLRRELASRPLTDYEVSHYGHRRMFSVWWTCRQCSSAVAPFESHGHLR